MRTKKIRLQQLMLVDDLVPTKKPKVKRESTTRLNNKELLQLLPRLPLHQQLFIEIKINGIWKPLFEGAFFKRSKTPIACNLCQTEITPSLFLCHFTLKSHINRLERVDQFYHPIYTFGKDEWQYAKGLKLPENGEGARLRKLDFALTKQFHVAKLYLSRIQKFMHFFADVRLPLNDLLEIEFCAEKNEVWKPAVIPDVNKINPKFSCNICMRGRFTPVTIYTHFRGRSHLKRQDECFEIRSKKYPQINKHCMFIFGERFFMNINNKIAWNNLYTPVDVELEFLPSLGGGDSEEDNEGLIGVEYVVQITSADHNHEVVMHECCLCESVTDTPADMQLHLIGFDHRLKYCEMHFGKILDKYKVAIGTINYVNYKHVMNYILHRLAAAIESHHSRAMPMKVDEVIFHNERVQVIIDIYNLPHASQWSGGPSFANIITNKEINDVKMNIINYLTPAVSAHCCARFLTLPKENYLKIEKSHNSSVERELHHYKTPSPLSPEQEFGDVSPIYLNNQIKVEAAEIEDLYRGYRKNPESHPEYESEWNDFWKQKRRELLAQGIDHHTYDFQPEWVLYFKNRLEDLYMESLLSVKPNAVQDEGNHFIDVAAHKPVKHRLAKNSIRTAKQPRLDYSISIDNRENLDRRREPSLPPRNQEERFAYNNDKTNIIHVLRNLSAVEDHLGSVGTKILDLLSEALCLEKNVTNTDELYKLMLTPQKCSILELANEKLKGLLFAGLIGESKIPIFNRIINSTTDLLKYASHINDNNNATFPPNGGNYRNGGYN